MSRFVSVPLAEPHYQQQYRKYICIVSCGGMRGRTHWRLVFLVRQWLEEVRNWAVYPLR